MNEERLQEIADKIGTVFVRSDKWSDALDGTVELLRLAIKESSQEKDEVIRKLVDSVDDPEKLLRALNTLG